MFLVRLVVNRIKLYVLVRFDTSFYMKFPIDSPFFVLCYVTPFCDAYLFFSPVSVLHFKQSFKCIVCSSTCQVPRILREGIHVRHSHKRSPLPLCHRTFRQTKAFQKAVKTSLNPPTKKINRKTQRHSIQNSLLTYSNSCTIHLFV